MCFTGILSLSKSCFGRAQTSTNMAAKAAAGARVEQLFSKLRLIAGNGGVDQPWKPDGTVVQVVREGDTLIRISIRWEGGAGGEETDTI
jgi:hypothetical protein